MPGSGEGSGTEVRRGSAGFRCRYLGEVPEGPVQMLMSWFQKVLVQSLAQVPEGCGADIQVRIQKVPIQRLGEVPEGSGADT